MLSVASVGAEKATKYYSDDNYYTKDKGIENSDWWGKGAKEMGLSGKVNADAFENLLHGKSADGNQQLVNKRSKAKAHKERAGLDMTFSASKSVSLCALEDPRIVEAHKKAVNEALMEIEKELSFVRLGKERKVVAGGNLIVAQFHHDTSRKVTPKTHPDPQLHTHAVGLNMVQVEDDKNGKRWLSHYNDGVFNNSKLMGMVYQNRLGHELKKLGYEIVPNGNGTLEIAGVSREHIETFSKRWKQIGELNARSKKEERSKMLGQRLAKGEEIPTETLKKYWLSEFKELGISTPKPPHYKNYRVERDPYAAEKAIDSAIRHLTERDVSFRDKKALSFAFENNVGNLPSYSAVKRALEDDERTIAHSVNYFGEKNYTTPQAILRDAQTVRYMEEGKGKFPAIASEAEVKRIIDSKPAKAIVDGKEVDMRFTKGQTEAFTMVCRSEDQVVGWQGVAGAGKSYALNDFRALSEQKQYEVIGLAPDAAAAEALQEGSKLSEAKTIASFLKSPVESTKQQIWLVDEAGKVNAREMHDLLEKAVNRNARVVLVGDTRQLSGVEAGNPFRMLQDKGMATAHLTEHRRQKEEKLQRAVELLADGQVSAGLSQIRSEVIENARESTRVHRISDEYILLSEKERSKTLVLAGTNDMRREVLAEIREKLKQEGRLTGGVEVHTLKSKDFTRELGNYAPRYEPGDFIVPQRDFKRQGVKRGESYEVVSYNKNKSELLIRDEIGRVKSLDPSKVSDKAVFQSEKQEVSIGDRLKWTLNDYKQGRLNGDILEVVGIEKDKLILKSWKDGKAVGQEIVVSSKERQYLDHALVSTAYSSQGKTSDRVLLAGDSSIGKESMYVAISRAKYAIKIFVDSYDKMVKRAERSQSKKYALELFKDVEKSEGKEPVKAKDQYLADVVNNLKSGKHYTAFTKLNPFVKEVSDTKERYTQIAKYYASLSKDEQAKTRIIGGTSEEARLLKSYVRKELFESGALTNLEKVTLLEPKEKEKKKLSVDVGDILIPSKASSIYKYRKGVQYEVTGIDKDDILVKSPSGKSVLIKAPDFKGKAYALKQNSIAEGDEVHVHESGNISQGRIVEIRQGKALVSFEDGRSKTFSTDKPLPMEHSVVQQSFNRVGADKDRVILSCEHTIGSKAMEQAVDRAKVSVDIYTNSKPKLEQRFKWYQSQQESKVQSKAKAFQAEMESFHSREAKKQADRSPEIGLGV